MEVRRYPWLSATMPNGCTPASSSAFSTPSKVITGCCGCSEGEEEEEEVVRSPPWPPEVEVEVAEDSRDMAAATVASTSCEEEEELTILQNKTRLSAVVNVCKS